MANIFTKLTHRDLIEIIELVICRLSIYSKLTLYLAKYTLMEEYTKKTNPEF